MHKEHNTRLGIVFFTLVTLYAAVIINLYCIQVKKNNFFSHLGTKQYASLITITPERAPIMDRSGTLFLATNKDALSAFITPNKLESAQTLMPFLKEHFPQSIPRLSLQNNRNFMYLKRRLSDAELALIKQHNLPDIKLLREPSRYYPNPSTAPVIGITDIDNNGTMGIELLYNNHLAGQPTTCFLERDARLGHFYFSKETKVQGHSGKPITLTLQSDLQFLAYEEVNEWVKKYGAHTAAALIMNPQNGEILAMVNAPGFDPHDTQTLDLESAKNFTVAESYELGSVIKVCAALAALEEGVVTADELINCRNTKTTILEGRTINTWKAHGLITFKDVLRGSNNIGTAIVAKRLGTKLYDYYNRLGFGSKTGIELPGEQTGFINPPAKWSKQSIISLSYGYEIRATLLQIARAFGIIATGGLDVHPTIIMGSKQQPLKRLFSENSTHALKEILEAVPTDGVRHLAAIDGCRVMSKTGTARTLVDGVYSEKKHLYTCAGIIEKGDYQRVIVVFIKEPTQYDEYAYGIATPLFRKLAEKIVIHDKVV